MKSTKCIVCNATEKRLHCFSNAKSIKRNSLNLLQNFVGKLPKSLDSGKIHSCNKCMAFLENADIFRNNIKRNLTDLENDTSRTDSKRCATTPISDLKRRVAVTEKLRLSVEKLANLTLSGMHKYHQNTVVNYRC